MFFWRIKLNFSILIKHATCWVLVFFFLAKQTLLLHKQIFKGSIQSAKCFRNFRVEICSVQQILIQNKKIRNRCSLILNIPISTCLLVTFYFDNWLRILNFLKIICVFYGRQPCSLNSNEKCLKQFSACVVLICMIKFNSAA